jgi:hypothetical protein
MTVLGLNGSRGKCRSQRHGEVSGTYGALYRIFRSIGPDGHITGSIHLTG